MKIIQETPDELRLSVRKEDNGLSFVFDWQVLEPHLIKPHKQIVIQAKHGSHLREWRMGWRKFLKQSTIGDTLLLRKSAFQYFENGKLKK